MTTTRLDRTSDRPLYEQLAERLTAELRDFSIGGKFHTDRALVKKYAVSPHVVRQALSLMVADGLIERIVSKGTFVRAWERHAPPEHTKRVAVFCPIKLTNGSTPHFAGVLGITEILEPAGYAMEIHNNHPNGDITELISSKLPGVDGAIWISPMAMEFDEAPAGLLEHAKRLVLLNVDIAEPGLTRVVRGDEAAVFAMATRLIKTGRRRIAFIGGPEDRAIARQRHAGYERALKAADMTPLPALFARHGEHNLHKIAGGEVAMETIFAKGESPDAVVCMTDHLAAGAVNCLVKRNLRIPEDVAVTGFDDNDDVRENHFPELTSARLPFQEEGRQAARLLLAQLNDDQNPGQRLEVPCPLFFRRSSEPATSTQETLRTSISSDESDKSDESDMTYLKTTRRNVS